MALRWDPADQRAAPRVTDLAATLHSRGWQLVVNEPGWHVLSDPQAPPVMMADKGRIVVIGHLFGPPLSDDRSVQSKPVPGVQDDFSELCGTLIDDHWGAYVALARLGASSAALAVFRDPLGLVECVTWRCGGLRIVTSRGCEIMKLARPDRLAIDWTRLGQIIRCPGGAGDALPFDGVEAIAPATVTYFEPARSERPLWSPARVARHPLAQGHERHTDPVALIGACIEAWSERLGPGLAELSGGLDSAVVAAGLVRCQLAGAMRWLHFHAEHAPSDERPFARAVAAHLGLPCDEIIRPETFIDVATVESIPLGLRPSVASLSLFHDQALALRARDDGAKVVFTGQGGDALFYQLATPAIADDIWRASVPIARKIAATRDLARWSATSVWTVAGAAVRARLGPTPLPDPHFPLDLVASAIPRRQPALAWLDDADGLPPSRQVPVLQLAAIRAILAPSWSSQVTTVVHPLLSQPIVEHFLARSPLDLTEARRDRALIRQAYAGRLPAMLLERRGKGCVSAYYGRMIARSLPFLRAYLLDGLLVAQGVLERGRLETVLDEDFLIQTNAYAEIFCALFAERWARGWHAITASA